MDLAIIRHGQSVGNVQKRLQGRAEFPLTDLGRDQATRLGTAFARDRWTPTRVYSSPLRRAAETAEVAIAQFEACTGHRLPPLRLEPNLEEYDCGIFEGLTWAEARDRYGDLCDRLETTPDWLPIPNAETPRDGRDRSRAFFEQLFRDADNRDRIWVFTHSWIMKHLISELLGSDRSWKIPTHNTGIFEFRIDRDRWHSAIDPQQSTTAQNRYTTDLWKIKRFNDTAHLIST